MRTVLSMRPCGGAGCAMAGSCRRSSGSAAMIWLLRRSVPRRLRLREVQRRWRRFARSCRTGRWRNRIELLRPLGRAARTPSRRERPRRRHRAGVRRIRSDPPRWRTRRPSRRRRQHRPEPSRLAWAPRLEAVRVRRLSRTLFARETSWCGPSGFAPPAARSFPQSGLAEAVEHQVREFSRIGRNLDENMRLI